MNQLNVLKTKIQLLNHLRTSPFEEGGTEEYLWSQTTSVKLRGGSLGIPGKTALQSCAKYLYT